MAKASSRRNFIKAAGAIAAGALLPKQLMSRGVESGGEVVPNVDRLTEFGLGAWREVYEAGKKIEDKYKVQPVVFGSIYAALKAVENGETTDPESSEIRSLKEGWGGLIHARSEHVNQWLDNVFVIADSQEKADEIKGFLKTFGNLFPVLLLVSPDTLTSTPGRISSFTDKEIKISDMLTTPNRVLTMIHEAVHAFDRNWKSVVPYMQQRDFINLVKTEFEGIKKVLDTFTSLKEEDAITLRGGRPPFYVNVLEPEKANVQRYIDELSKEARSFCIDLPEADPEAPLNELRFQANKLFNIYAYRMLRMLSTSDKRIDPVAESISEHIPTDGVYSEAVLFNLSHVFKGFPVSRSGYEYAYDGDVEKGVIGETSEAIFRSRLRTTSSVPEDTPYSKLREIVGLPKPSVLPTIVKGMTALVGCATAALVGITASEVILEARKRREIASRYRSLTITDKRMILATGEVLRPTPLMEDPVQLTSESQVFGFVDGSKELAAIVLPPKEVQEVITGKGGAHTLRVMVAGKVFGFKDKFLHQAWVLVDQVNGKNLLHLNRGEVRVWVNNKWVIADLRHPHRAKALFDRTNK